MATREEQRRAKKKLRREARRRGENVQRRSRNRWTITTPPGPHIVKMCWECAGTGSLFRQTTKPRFEPCADCGAAGGILSN